MRNPEREPVPDGAEDGEAFILGNFYALGGSIEGKRAKRGGTQLSRNAPKSLFKCTVEDTGELTDYQAFGTAITPTNWEVLFRGPTQVVQTARVLTLRGDFVQFFVISLTLPTITNYTRNPIRPVHSEALRITQALHLLDS